MRAHPIVAIPERWRQITLEANALFQRGDLPLALRAYERTLALALDHLEACLSPMTASPKRPEYIAAFYRVIDWTKVERRWREAEGH